MLPVKDEIGISIRTYPMEQDALESALQTSHGRGRWFETSIAHSKNMPICRQNAAPKTRRKMDLGAPCSNRAAT